MTASLGIAVVIALLAAACAQSAMELPPDMSRLGPEDRLQPGDQDDLAFALQCSDISQAIIDVKNERLQHEAQITETRVRNQMVIFPIPAFPFAVPLALLADPNITEHKAIRALEERLDMLDRIRVAKRCAAH
ncbi:MAG: hypothetical protein KGL32_06790 [candidate division NC10 bacterium]|nr:hypothetical protein [candidate division NC10 bacterium]